MNKKKKLIKGKQTKVATSWVYKVFGTSDERILVD